MIPGYLRHEFRATLVIAIILALSGAVASATNPFPGGRAKWQYYQSPNFELYSQQQDKPSRDLLMQLELLHHTVLVANRVAVRQPLPVTVYLFDNRRDFEAYLTPEMAKATIGGLYLSQPDRATILLTASERPEFERRAVYHEYIHHLTWVSGRKPPLWLNEGMAELFSTVEVKSGKLIFGRHIPEHVGLLRESRLIALPALFNSTQSSVMVGGSSHSGLFYAQSWALLHFWYFGKVKTPKDNIDGFISLMNERGQQLDAAQIREAFIAATGADYAAMEKQIEDYVRSGKYQARTLPLPKDLPARGDFSVRAVPADEQLFALAELALRMRRDPRARFVLLEAINSPRGLRAREVLGTMALMEGDEHIALQRWRDAAAAGSTNPALYHQLALREGGRWFRQFDYYFRLPEERADELRSLLLRSIKNAPQQSVAYEILAWVESAAPRPDIANVNLVQKRFADLQDRAHTLLALAMVRIRLGDREAALSLLDDIAALGPSLHTQRSVSITRDILEGRTPQPAVGSLESVFELRSRLPSGHRP